MRLLYPRNADLEPDELYVVQPPAGADRTRPWVVVNMVATLDGAVTVDGRSGPLGGPGDKAVFGALRAAADVVLVGAGTVRAERYKSPTTPGQRIAVVSRALDLDWTWPLFTEGHAVVVTTTSAGPVPADVAALRVGDDDVDLPAALHALHEQGAQVVVAEGGPRLNGTLLAGDLVDEVCLTVAPMLAVGPGGRFTAGAPVPLQRLALVHVATADDGYLFLRYARAVGS